MALPYRARVNERWFLNLPGFHGGAYVVAYVEDTSKRDLERCDHHACDGCLYNFEPRMILELADCRDRINLEFDVDSDAGRANSLHKLDTLITALRIFRDGIVAEFEPYDRRQRELDELLRDEPGTRPGIDDLRPLASVAQRTERRASNPRVRGSTPLGGLFGRHDTVAERRGTRLQSAYRAVRLRRVSLR
jgi:hypothetical protein